MNVLVIDDEAEKGWAQILERILEPYSPAIKVAFNYDQAIFFTKIEEYDLIFLDLRFGETDHFNSKIEEFGGYKTLRTIKSDLSYKNFPTPVILFTATNKVWNIYKMLDLGADDFYIKEHPDLSYDLSFSQENYVRLLNTVEQLVVEGKKRKNIIKSISQIKEWSSSNIKNENIRRRVYEKLTIGYGLLFRRTTQFEQDKFLFNNEVLAFIAFWSILEEVSKDFFKDNWIKKGDKEGTMVGNRWVLRNGAVFIEDNVIVDGERREGNFRIGIGWDPKISTYISKTKLLKHDSPDISRYRGIVFLSLQVYAIMLLYKNWEPIVAKNQFDPLNEYRNKIDFIHSSINSIFNDSLGKNQNSGEAFQKCKEMLDFIGKLIE